MPRLRLASLLLLAAPLAAAQSTTPPQPANLLGHTYFLRSLCAGDDLRFTPAGEPAVPCPHEAFTVALLTIDKVDPGKSELKLTAHRIGLSFHDVAHELDLSHPRRGRKPHDVTLHLAAPPSGDFAAPVAAVLTNRYADLLANLPEYWQGYAQTYLVHPPAAQPIAASTVDTKPLTQQEIDAAQTNAQADTAENEHDDNDRIPYPWGKIITAKIMKDGVTAPKLVKQKEADYSREARSMLAYGTCVIRLIVDEQGMPQHLAIRKPAGLGLDEQAIAAIQQYRFAPATKDGKPVPVVMNVEVNFQIL